MKQLIFCDGLILLEYADDLSNFRMTFAQALTEKIGGPDQNHRIIDSTSV